MVIEWSVIIGLAALIATIVGGVIARDRAIVRMIHNNHEDATKAIKDGDDVLHERVNRTRDDLSNHYVKRADLDGHLQRIEKSVTDMRQEIREERRDTNQRLDAVLQAVSTATKSS